MAGDIYYIQVRDKQRKLLDNKYIGKMRYTNIPPFSLINFVYLGDIKAYSLEHRLSNGRGTYIVWTKETIMNLKTAIVNEKPLTKQEEEAYEDAHGVMMWIEEKRLEYQGQDVDFVLFIDHDF